MIPRSLLAAAAVVATLAGVAAGAPARPAEPAAAAVGPTPWGARLAVALDAARCTGLPSLTATLIGTKGNEEVVGDVALSPVWMTANGAAVCVTHIEANVSGLPPATAHGFHIHTFGDVTRRDGKSAGGHFDPHEGMPHGLPEGLPAVLATGEGGGGGGGGGRLEAAALHHEGDMGNLESDAEGVVAWAGFNARVVLEHVVGRSIILHAAMDDGGQPTGNAGARLAQGILGYRQEEAPAAPPLPPPPPPAATASPEDDDGDAAEGE